jgi:CheY-like chemotaxis protein
MRCSETILLIDDNQPLLYVYQEVLLSQGYKTLAAGSVPIALELLAEVEPPDLILLDLYMPQLSGEDFLDALERDNPRVLRESFVAGFSAFSADVPSVRRFMEKVDAFFVKPVDLDDFVSLVRQLFEMRYNRHCSKPNYNRRSEWSD